MKLNHVNLTVPEVSETRRFLERYFGLRCREGAEGSSTFAVLFEDDGLVVTLMRSRREFQYPPSFHIGFMVESEATVNAIHQRLKEDGFEAEPPQRSHAWTFYVRAPGGFDVEVASP